MSDLVAKKKQTLALADKIANEQSQTLAMHGLNPADFKGTMVEALVSNPAVINADPGGLTRALRVCCQRGVLPNGWESAIIVNRDGSVRNEIMRDGWAKIAHRVLGATITSGFVTAGQDIEIIHDTKEGDSVRTKTTFGKRTKEEQEVIGSWCRIEVKGYPAYVHVFHQEDIEKAQAASAVKSDKGPWSQWKGRMAEKAVVKSCVKKALYMFPRLDTKSESEIRAIMDDDDRETLETEVIIDQPEAEVIEVEEVKPEPKAEKPKAAPRKRQTKPKATAKKAKPKPAPADEVPEAVSQPGDEQDHYAPEDYPEAQAEQVKGEIIDDDDDIFDFGDDFGDDD